MFDSLLIGTGGIVMLMILWMAVQSLWGKIFYDHLSDEDVLAGRTRCSNCGCTTICKEKGRQLSTK